MPAAPPVISRLVIIGLGYCGEAIARAAAAAGTKVIGTHRSAAPPDTAPGVRLVRFDEAAPAIEAATHLLITAAPEPAGDPVLARHADAVAAARDLRWIGYLSTTGLYGDRGGGWVDEDTQPAPTGERGLRRFQAEHAWREAARGRALDIFRLAGIYGPGRSVLDDVRAGRARRIIKPGHQFGRIHREDIARAVLAAMTSATAGDVRVFNLTDDEPAENADVVAEAARLLGAPEPPAVPFAQAMASMSPMGRSFWAENRKVSSAKTKAALGIAWRYPTYRKGLRAILAEESGERSDQ